MATITVLNTSSDLSSKTLISAENPYTITGLHTFDRGPSAPFAVTSGSAVVTNLDADKLDGLDSLAFAILSAANGFTGVNTITNSSANPLVVTGTANATIATWTNNSSTGTGAAAAYQLTNSADTSYLMVTSTGYTGATVIGTRATWLRSIPVGAPNVAGMTFSCEHNSVAGGTFQWVSRGINTTNLVMSFIPGDGSVTGGVFKVNPHDNGNACAGNQVYVGRNNNGIAPFAGALALEKGDGTPYFLWVDAANKLRIGTAPPGSGISDTSGTIVGTQS